MRQGLWILVAVSAACSSNANLGTPATISCPHCTPGAGDGVCVDSCPPGGAAEGNALGAPCNYPSSCPTGLTVCGDGSFPCLASDPANCGTCGHVCGPGQQCIYATCSAVCTGGAANLDSDPANCGSCGHACAEGEICGRGNCGASCGRTPSNCTGKAQFSVGDGGCPTCPSCTLGFAPLSTCVDMTSDTSNCGACGHVCGLGEVCKAGACTTACAAGQVCGEGACQSTCPPGTSACPGADGGSQICVDFGNDASNCGGCGNACAGCIAGKCVLACGYFMDAG